jgi:predicted transcriptional regulator
MSEKHAFIMMIKEKWWKEFRRHHHQGRNVNSYVRAGVAPPKNASTIFFYVTKPVGEIVGYGDFVERRVGEADEMWKELGHESALASKAEYKEFIGNKKDVSFVRFKNLQEAVKPLSLSNVLMLLGTKRLSRKGFYVSDETSKQLVSLMK